MLSKLEKYLSASIGTVFARLARISPSRLGLFSGCGVAAGLSAAYYAPFGAALFAMEVVLGNFSAQILGLVLNDFGEEAAVHYSAYYSRDSGYDRSTTESTAAPRPSA